MVRLVKKLRDRFNESVWTGRVNGDELVSAVRIRTDHKRACERDRGGFYVFNVKKLVVVWDQGGHDCP